MALCLEVVAVYGINLGFGRKVLEMNRLPRIRADARSDKHQPRQHLGALCQRIFRQEQTRLFGKVKQNGVAVEDNRITINQRRCFGIWVNSGERWRVLLAPAGVNWHQLVRQASLFKE